jgi:hypothetical protein
VPANGKKVNDTGSRDGGQLFLLGFVVNRCEA